MAFKVNASQCSTCIFGPNSPLTPERLEQYKAQWQSKNRVQECHHATMKHEKVGCRGHYEAARRGEIPHPITEIAEQLDLGQLRIEQMMHLSELVGWVEFVDVDRDANCTDVPTGGEPNHG